MYEKSAELVAIFDEAFARFTVAEAEERFARYDIACVHLSTTTDLLTDEQAKANNYIFHLKDFYGNDIMQPKSPLFFGDDEINEYKIAPRIGQHTKEILEELGYTKENIDTLVAEGRVRAE